MVGQEAELAVDRLEQHEIECAVLHISQCIGITHDLQRVAKTLLGCWGRAWAGCETLWDFSLSCFAMRMGVCALYQ